MYFDAGSSGADFRRHLLVKHPDRVWSLDLDTAERSRIRRPEGLGWANPLRGPGSMPVAHRASCWSLAMRRRLRMLGLPVPVDQFPETVNDTDDVICRIADESTG